MAHPDPSANDSADHTRGTSRDGTRSERPPSTAPEQGAPSRPYASRGGLKLEHALRDFALDVRGAICADFGCSTGGFTDCLLRHGAARVYALDTAYGQLAWTLRNDSRVVVMERTNCLHAQPPAPVDLVVVDASWTPQRLVAPAAAKWLRARAPSDAGPLPAILTLIKPHYELRDRKQPLPRGGVLEPAQAREVTDETIALLGTLGFACTALTRSPVLGGATGSAGKAAGAGNEEYLALLAPQPTERSAG